MKHFFLLARLHLQLFIVIWIVRSRRSTLHRAPGLPSNILVIEYLSIIDSNVSFIFVSLCAFFSCRGAYSCLTWKQQECMPIYELVRAHAITGYGRLGKVPRPVPPLPTTWVVHESYRCPYKSQRFANIHTPSDDKRGPPLDKSKKIGVSYLYWSAILQFWCCYCFNSYVPWFYFHFIRYSCMRYLSSLVFSI